MSSKEPTFLNEALYQATSQLMPLATAGNRKTIICLTDGTVDVPSHHIQPKAPGMAKVAPHTEEETRALVLHADATINAVIEKSALTYLIEASRHPHADDLRRYPPGNVKAYADVSGGVVVSSSKANGFDALLDLLDRLKSRYTIAYMDQAALVAIGGLNQDPFDDRASIGRVRRVYVRPSWRNKGIGQALVHTLVENARTSFTSLHLRTDNPTAARLYERIGFSRIVALNTTHVLNFYPTANGAPMKSGEPGG
jgi:GNAT superfamily N-acetyltransferase